MRQTMKVMLTALMVFAIMGITNVYGQEWSKDQLAVWQEVENGWAAWKKGDIDGAFKGIHEQYLGWNHDDPLPINKEKWKSMYEQWQDNLTVEYYDIQPARIIVEGNDAAVVYYFFEFYSVYQKGDMKKENSMEGRNVEFYVKDGGKWMLIGDMTYFEGDDD